MITDTAVRLSQSKTLTVELRNPELCLSILLGVWSGCVVFGRDPRVVTFFDFHYCSEIGKDSLI